MIRLASAALLLGCFTLSACGTDPGAVQPTVQPGQSQVTESFMSGADMAVNKLRMDDAYFRNVSDADIKDLLYDTCANMTRSVSFDNIATSLTDEGYTVNQAAAIMTQSVYHICQEHSQALANWAQ